MRIVGTRPGGYQLASNKENFKVRVFLLPWTIVSENEVLLRASGMSSASSPGAVSRVVGYSTTDPTTTFVRGIHTLKNGSYYKRSWTSGSPYSSVPIWLDMDHCPPQQREFVSAVRWRAPEHREAHVFRLAAALQWRFTCRYFGH